MFTDLLNFLADHRQPKLLMFSEVSQEEKTYLFAICVCTTFKMLLAPLSLSVYKYFSGKFDNWFYHDISSVLNNPYSSIYVPFKI